MGNTMDHNTFGEVQEHEYLPGVVLAVYPEDPSTPEEHWDTADVYIEELGLTQYNVPIFYHCSPEAPMRTVITVSTDGTESKQQTGSIVNAARGFMVGDRVILFCKIQTAQVGKQLVTDVVLISHEDGVKRCVYNYIIVRASLSPIKPFNVEDPDPEELVTVYDVTAKKVVTNIMDEDSNPLEFPCSTVGLLPFLDSVILQGVELFEYTPQGDDEIQVAGATPNWTADVNGEDIRGEDENWWTSYDYYGNPLQNFFRDVGFAIVTDSEGASDGSFSAAMGIVEDHESQIETWDTRSNAFRTDKRGYAVQGPEQQYDEDGFPIYPTEAIAVDGLPLDKATSQHIQTAYGENELWVCAVESFQGMIVSYCTEKWKFIRFTSLPPALDIPKAVAAWTEVRDDALMAAALPGSMAVNSLADLGTAIASEISIAGKGGENSIWSIGILKRINEGAFHRTTHPATTGSNALRTTAIPEDIYAEPRYFSALNRRWDKIGAWYRYDNWQNTWNCIYSSWGVDITWWFMSRGLQWGAESIYTDTPIGSMWLQAPNWKSATWSMPDLFVSGMTARRDYPLNQQLLSMAKHSRTVVSQLYVVQRTSVTLWAEQEDIFIRQKLGEGPYFSIPPEKKDVEISPGEWVEKEVDAISYIKMPDDSLIHILDATNEQIESVLSDRMMIFTDGPHENLPLQSNRNEFEIMGAADMYGALKKKYSRRNPMDQERTPEFEAAVADLIDKIMDSGAADTSFDEVFLDMEIV